MHTIRSLLATALVGFGLAGAAQAQDMPAFCGPSGQLPDDFSKNVAADSRCFEIRMYTANEAEGGDIDTLHQRFREGEVALFEKHGAEIVAVWQRMDDPNTMVWMLAYRDRAHRDEVFEMREGSLDPGILRARTAAAQSHDVVGVVQIGNHRTPDQSTRPGDENFSHSVISSQSETHG